MVGIFTAPPHLPTFTKSLYFSLWSVFSPHHRVCQRLLKRYISLVHQGIEFFTATCLNWQPLLQPEEHKQIILDSLNFLVNNKRIWLYGYVIMPNHIHILWAKQPEWLDKNVQQHFSKFTAQNLKWSLQNNPEDLGNYRSTQIDREYQFWERRPYKATMYSRTVLEEK